MGAVSENSAGGNIIPFSADQRLNSVRYLKRLIALAFVVSVFVSAYVYRYDLNMNNIKRIASYINLGASMKGMSPAAMELDSGISNRYAVIGGGIAVLNRDTLKYLNAAGGTDMEVQLGYARPAISSSDNLLLCYDRGSNSLCVASTYEVFFQKTMGSPIISASMSENGVFSIVTDENGFRAAVTVFDSHQKEVYLWKTSEYFISSSSLSPSGKKMAAAVFSGNGINIASKVVLFDITKDEPLCEFSTGENSILAVHFISESRFTVVTNTNTSVYDINDGLIHSLSYNTGTLSAFSFPDDRGALLALSTESANQSIRLLMLDKNGEETAQTVLLGEIQGISSSGRYCAILSTDKAYYFNRELEAFREPEEARGAKEIYVRDDGAAFLIFNNRAELVLPQQP